MALEIKRAFERRSEEIYRNLDSLTLKSVRQQLAKDLGVPADDLKDQKAAISSLIDQLIERKAKAADAGEAADGGGSGEEDGDGGPLKENSSAAQAPNKRGADAPAGPGAKSRRTKLVPQTDGKTAARKARAPLTAACGKASSSVAARRGGAGAHSRAIQRLREVLKAATIPISPTVYVRNKTDGELEAALRELLAKHGLNGDSGSSEVAKVRAGLQRARDLDGIDASNIVVGGRGRRAAAARAPVPIYASSSEEDSAGESDEEEVEADGSDSDFDSADEGAATASQHGMSRPARVGTSVPGRGGVPLTSLRPTEVGKTPTAAESGSEAEDSGADSAVNTEESDLGVGGRSNLDSDADSTGATDLEDSDDAAPASRRRVLD